MITEKPKLAILLTLIPFFLIDLHAASAAKPKPIGMFHPHCHTKKKIKRTPGNEIDLSKHSFQATLDCVHQCAGNKIVQHSVLSKTFDPKSEGMRMGDGYSNQEPMMASFTTYLMNWASQACLSSAEEKCSSLEKVESSDYVSISSGNWKMTEKPSCEQNLRNIPSPYDSDFTLQPGEALPGILEARRIFLKELGKAIPFFDQKKPTACKTILKGKVCFGDCIIYDEKNPKAKVPVTLMSKESPVFDQEEWVCADSLVTQLSAAATKFSTSVVETLCQMYYTQTLAQPQTSGSSCAAFRGAADCKEIVTRFSRK